MEDVLYLTLLIIAVAFALTVVFIVIVLHRFTKLLRTAGSTLGQVETDMQQTIPELQNTLHQTQVTVDDIGEKLQATDSLFDTAENLGHSVNHINQAIQKTKPTLTSNELEEETKLYVEGIRWSAAASYLYKQWKGANTAAKKTSDSIDQTGKEG
ncbi:general stress protein [Virgibacillus pantothenticus]|uniref:General stress protein n=1 Tax=Virgibacillus pantothenticus TaxID=1473 RepID=A0A0L0QWL8_VIRPA|nr:MULTISPECIES: DUF948 domain-containing protein [Virgibacillus]API92457.1 hypothetical protein BKP57_11855 [Virgibacillus sp. 6R]KNE22593.1 hypothetical protein AFK71_00050 [Virgibacillus pantothenticus]MBS7427292.1 DUF948 domain-containing protein [Virgibacillus sp. 19R1-5]MBU8567062.1 DUF948 domain-containing protein [Virgibacillus pantothenticus]MBU8601987.1 DUF948 domain-containing protein [Virgibacillus pantothenticus]